MTDNHSPTSSKKKPSSTISNTTHDANINGSILLIKICYFKNNTIKYQQLSNVEEITFYCGIKILVCRTETEFTPLNNVKQLNVKAREIWDIVS